jgi:hypothetical protein
MKIVAGRPYYSDTLGIDDPDGVIRGIFVGSCIDERNAWSVWEGASGHSHNVSKSDWFGWICILNPKDVLTPSGKITAALAHEICHLLCPDAGHSRAWKVAVTKMGFPGEITRTGLKPL